MNIHLINNTPYQHANINNDIMPQVINNNANNHATICQNNNNDAAQRNNNPSQHATNNTIINQLPNILSVAPSSTSTDSASKASNKTSKSKWRKGNRTPNVPTKSVNRQEIGMHLSSIGKCSNAIEIR